MLVDCDGCAMRDVACMECAVGVLLGLPGAAKATDASGSAATERPGGAATDRDDWHRTGGARSGSPAATGPASEADDVAESRPIDAFAVVEQWPGRRPFEWDATERRAIKALIDGGLIPPIRPARRPDAVTRRENLGAERGRLAG